jgi:putative resolvase
MPMRKVTFVVRTYQEIGSDLNERRRNLEQVYNMLRRREADMVLVEFKDRLTRFGFSYLEQPAESYGGRVEVVENDVKKDVVQELVEDMISIVSFSSAKLYGYRSQKFKKLWGR